jgi:hypothetical protein
MVVAVGAVPVGTAPVVVGALVDAAGTVGEEFVESSLEETRTATITPATAATATAAAARAFFTKREATLAPRCQNGSKSS